MFSKSFQTSDLMSENDVIDVHFDIFSSEARLRCHPVKPSHSAQFYCCLPEGERSPARLWSAVQRGTSQDSNQFLVTGHAECRDWPVPSWACSLTLSKLTAGATPFCANSWKKHSITQLANTRVSEFRPCESEVKNWTDHGTWQFSWNPVQLGLRDRSNRFCLGFVPGSNLSGIQV